MEQPPVKKKHRLLRFLVKLVLTLLLLFVLLILFIRSPWGQDIIVQKVVNYASEKTGSNITLERLFVTFDGDIHLEGLFMEDLSGDTLIYANSVEADIPIWPIIRGNGIAVDEVLWDGLRANITRNDSLTGFNFDFLMEAFASDSSQIVTTDTIPSSPLDISLGMFDFKNFYLVYEDDVMGIDSRLILGSMALDFDEFDLEEMRFELDNLTLKHVNLGYHQTKSFPSSTEEGSGKMPFVKVSEIDLEHIAAHYDSEPDGLKADLDIGQLLISLPSIDLTAPDFVIEKIGLYNSDISVQSTNQIKGVHLPDSTSLPQDSIFTFEWPELIAEIGNLDIQNNAIAYSVNGAQPKVGEFKPESFSLSELDVMANDISIKDGSAHIALQDLSFKDASGVDLSALGFNLSLSDDEMNLKDMAVYLNSSSLQGDVDLNYPSIQTLIDDPSVAQLDLFIESLQLNMADVFQIQPSLKEIEPLLALSKKPIRGRTQLTGSLEELQLTNTEVNWGSSTGLNLEGEVKQLLDMENLQFDFPQLAFNSTRTDMRQFVDDKSLGIRLPDRMALQTHLEGDLEQLKGEANIKTNLGDIVLEGKFDMKEQIAYELSSQVTNLQLNTLLQDDQFGPITLSINSKGSGNDIQSLHADLDLLVDQMQLNDYVLKDLTLKGTMKDGVGNLASRYKDQNLNAELAGIVRLNMEQPTYSLNLDVIGVDMEALGLTDKPIRAALQLEAELIGDADNFNLDAAIDQATFVYDSDAYRLDRLDITAFVSPDSTSALLTNDLIDLELRSNVDPNTFSQAVMNHLRSYFDNEAIGSDSLKNPVMITLDGTISSSPVLSEVFLDKLQDMDTVRIALDFNEQKRLLFAKISAPHIDYDGYELDSLRFTLDTRPDEFDFDLGFAQVEAGPILLKRTTLSGKESKGSLNLIFDSFEGDEQLIHISSTLSGDGQALQYSINPKDLTFNNQPWTIPAENNMRLEDNELNIQNFILSNDQQSIEFTDQFSGIENDHLAVVFDRFELSDFLNYLNPDEELASGQLQGNLVIQNPFGDLGVMADLDIKQLNVLKVDMGKLELDASSNQIDTYDIDLSLKEGNLDLDLNGNIQASGTSPDLDLTLDLNAVNVKAFEQFAEQNISDARGSLNGRFAIKGQLDSPDYSGRLNFDDAGFKLVSLNSAFSLPDDFITLDNDGIQFDKFTLLDADGNAFDLSGAVLTDELLNPQFDLNINATNFKVLNATPEDNEMVYGLAIFDAKGTIKGDLEIPIVDLTLMVDPKTDLTYVLPPSVAQVERMDGVVAFVNRKHPDAILTRSEEVTASLAGFDITAMLKISQEAKVTMVLDDETGDFFEVSGQGDLKFGMEPNGRISLAGVYNVLSGTYEMNLYGLVNRRFELSPDSKVSWAGDPLDAKLDLRAIYRQEASSAPLMASITSGLDPTAKSRYRQVLPFFVYLDIDGVLDAPEISFTLDMPDDEQGALNGQVYGRLQQVNQQEEELNKQVFSLLVLNRFYPEAGSDGSAGGVASVARDNLNDAVSDQLNTFSEKLLGKSGVQLDFGLDTYTDYQGDAPTERTQLEVAAKKSLLNDRLSVSVGSEVDIEGSGNASDGTTPLIGKVSIEYALTPDGQYRLKGFRRNDFENVIDGQTIVSGIALIFSQEFNEFDELWRAMLRKEKTTKGKTDGK